mmetsp:Transcript_14284/g.43142  ORF Transcript_14284/g.43142 Transcript_14284/m.43142 type:complete len:203 (+) Transcript_14284:1169-1777(+)
MHHLVEAALQECGIDGAEWHQPLARQPRREGHRVLLGDSDVEGALRVAGGEAIHAGAAPHGGMDANDPRVPVCLREQRIRKHVRVRRCLGGALELLAGEGVKLADTVHAVRGAQCRVVATPLVRDYVDQHRPGRFGGLHILEHIHQVLHVVAVHGADVVQAQLLEQGAAAAADHAAGILVNLAGSLLHACGQQLGDSLDTLT